MAKQSSQKFIARNRAPRVQIEYDVELYGAEKKVQLPFVMGVMADLAGKPAEPLAPVAERDFLEVDVDNFDARMKSIKPRVAFNAVNRAEAEARGARWVDVTAQSRDPGAAGLLADDGLHPSAAAYDDWARRILPTALSVLGSGG